MRLHDRKKTSPPVKDTLGKCATAAAGALLAMATGETTDAWKWYTLACALVVSEVSRNVQQTKLPFIGASLLTLPFALLYPRDRRRDRDATGSRDSKRADRDRLARQAKTQPEETAARTEESEINSPRAPPTQPPGKRGRTTRNRQ